MSTADLSPELKERVEEGILFLAEATLPITVTFQLIGGSWTHRNSWNNEAFILQSIVYGRNNQMDPGVACQMLQEIFQKAKKEHGFRESSVQRKSKLVPGKNDVFITLTKT